MNEKQEQYQVDGDGWPVPSEDVRRELEWRPPAWGDRPVEAEPAALTTAY